MRIFEYGSIKGYSPKRLTEKLLAKARTGLYAGNPAMMVLMAREIDRLRREVAVYKDREEHVEGMGID